MKEYIKLIIRWLSSLTVTISVLLLMVLTAVLNLLLENSSYSSMDIRYSSEFIPRLISFFGLLDLSRSFWFRSLLVAFGINQLACMLSRLPRTLSQFRILTEELCALPKNAPFSKNLKLPLNFSDFQSVLDKIAALIPFQHKHSSTNETVFFMEKGRFAFLGFYLSHIGLLIVLIGAIISTTGYSGRLYLTEGDSTSFFLTSTNGEPRLHELGFTCRLDRLEMIMEQFGTASNQRTWYRSTWTLQKGSESEIISLKGHENRKRGSIRLSQISMDTSNHRVSLRIFNKNISDNNARSITGKIRDIVTLPCNSRLHIKNIVFPSRYLSESSPHGDIAQFEKPIPEQVVFYDIFLPDGKKTCSGHAYECGRDVMEMYKDNNESYQPEYEICLESAERTDPVHWAVIKVDVEPGSGFIWGGIYISIFGFCLIFLLSHQRVWLSMTLKDDELAIAIAGWDSRRTERLEQLTETIINALQTGKGENL